MASHGRHMGVTWHGRRVGSRGAGPYGVKCHVVTCTCGGRMGVTWGVTWWGHVVGSRGAHPGRRP
eukprot:6111991-Prymnesium_polylepis.1